MEFQSTLDAVRNAFDHPLAIVIVIVILLAYRYASAKTRHLPVFPIGLLIISMVLRLALLLFPETVEESGFQRFIRIGSVIALYCAIIRLFFAFFVDLLREWRGKPKLPKISRDFILIALYAITTFFVLRTHGNFDPLGLITTSAVLTAVVGLAAQNTLGNLFSGLSIQMERPYRIGDWIRFREQVGQVVGIGWKSTRVLTLENELVFIPNLDITKSMIVNYSKPTKRHVMTIDVGVEYGASPDAVRRVLLDVLRDDGRVLPVPAPEVRVMTYGDFAITYQLRFSYNDYGISQKLRADVQRDFWYALGRAGIRIPFPIRDVHLRHVERRHEQERAAVLRRAARARLDEVPILASLGPAERDRLAEGLRIETFGEGETIVQQGEPGETLYILHRGECDVLIGTSKVAAMQPPEFFGEMSLLTGAPRSATVRAAEELTVFTIDKAAFSGILTANPNISEALGRALAERQHENDDIAGRARAAEAADSSKLVRRIKAFFGIR